MLRKSPRHSVRKKFPTASENNTIPLQTIIPQTTKSKCSSAATISSGSAQETKAPLTTTRTHVSSMFAAVCVLFFIYLQIVNTTFTLSSIHLSPEALAQSRALLRGTFAKGSSGSRDHVDVMSIVNKAAQRARTATLASATDTTDFDGDIVHVVYTRFMQTQHTLIELGKARAELFRAFCLPSVVHQTKQNFLWIIRADPLLEDSLRDEMIELLKPYPHFLLIASNKDSSGLRNATMVPDIMDTSKVLSGDASLIQKFHQASQTRTVLETRLDADDALHVEFLENMQQTARKVFSSSHPDASQESNADVTTQRRLSSSTEARSPSKSTDLVEHESAPLQTTHSIGKWMYWCADVHMEWHPGKDKHTSGMLIARMPKHCVTPGLTKGYEVGMSPSDLPSEPHHKLLSRIKECTADTIEQGGCVKRMELIPSSLRARTVTSAGMADVGIDVEGRTSDKWWEDIRDTFGIRKEDATRAKKYLQDHEVDIAIENLKGQCTQGHSCKQRAKDRINALLAEKAQLLEESKKEDTTATSS